MITLPNKIIPFYVYQFKVSMIICNVFILLCGLGLIYVNFLTIFFMMLIMQEIYSFQFIKSINRERKNVEYTYCPSR